MNLTWLLTVIVAFLLGAVCAFVWAVTSIYNQLEDSEINRRNWQYYIQSLVDQK